MWLDMEWCANSSVWFEPKKRSYVTTFEMFVKHYLCGCYSSTRKIMNTDNEPLQSAKKAKRKIAKYIYIYHMINLLGFSIARFFSFVGKFNERTEHCIIIYETDQMQFIIHDNANAHNARRKWGFYNRSSGDRCPQNKHMLSHDLRWYKKIYIQIHT